MHRSATVAATIGEVVRQMQSKTFAKRSSQWLCGTEALAFRSKGLWIETHQRQCTVSRSKSLYPLLSTGLIQEYKTESSRQL